MSTINDADYEWLDDVHDIKHEYMNAIDTLCSIARSNDELNEMFYMISKEVFNSLIDELKAYASHLTNALVLSESTHDDAHASHDACVIEPVGKYPPPDDISIARDCIDRLMRNANSHSAILTNDEAWNLLALFEFAYPSYKTTHSSL